MTITFTPLYLGLKELAQTHLLVSRKVSLGGPTPASKLPPLQGTPCSVMGVQRFLAPSLLPDGCHANLPSDQDPAVLERPQLTRSSSFMKSATRWVMSNCQSGLSRWLAGPRGQPLGHKLGEDPHHGVLVLEGDSPAPRSSSSPHPRCLVWA